MPAGERGRSGPSASLRPLGIAPAVVDQPPCGPTRLKTSILGACRQRLSSTMLTAVRGEPTTTRPAALGLPQGERGGRTGCPARPSAGAAAAAGRARLWGRYARAGERRSAAPAAGTSCVPRRLGVAAGCWTPADITHRKTSGGCRMRLSLVVLFPSWMAAAALEGPSWKRGYGGSQLL